MWLNLYDQQIKQQIFFTWIFWQMIHSTCKYKDDALSLNNPKFGLWPEDRSVFLFLIDCRQFCQLICIYSDYMDSMLKPQSDGKVNTLKLTNFVKTWTSIMEMRPGAPERLASFMRNVCIQNWEWMENETMRRQIYI